MFNHRNDQYQCPFCGVVAGVEAEHIFTKQADVIYSDRQITAFISSHWFKNNPGHVLIVPNVHFENLYDMPDELLSAIHIFSKKVAIAFKKVYGTDGVSTKQHNEPDGGQNVFHYHLHVFPRYKDDELYLHDKTLALSDEFERAKYAATLREYFDKN